MFLQQSAMPPVPEMSGPDSKTFNTRYRRRQTEQGARVSVPQRRTDFGGEFDTLFVNWLNYHHVPVTAALINNVLAAAEWGWPRDQAALIQAVMDKDPMIKAHIQTRIQAVMGAKWDIVSSDNDTAKASAVKKILEKAKINELKRHLMDCVATGYSGSFIKWGAGAGTIEGFDLVHPVNWLFDMEGNWGIIFDDGTQHGLNEFNPYQFVVHKHAAMPGIPSYGGLVRGLVWLYFFKQYGMKHRARYLEKFGIPFILSKISDADFVNEQTRNRIKAALMDIGSSGVAVVTQGTEIQAQAPGTTGSNASFQEWFDYIDKIYAILILGQEATSGKAQGLSNGGMQDKVRQDLFIADCSMLEETIQTQVVAPLEFFKWRTESLKFKIDYEPPEDLEKWLKILKGLQDAGIKVKRSWIVDKFGVPLEEATDDATGGAGDSVSSKLAGGSAPSLLGALGGGVEAAAPMTVQPPPPPIPAPTAEPVPANDEPAQLAMSDLSFEDKKKVYIKAFADAYADDTVSDSSLPDEVKGRIFTADDPVAAIDEELSQSHPEDVRDRLSAVKSDIEINAPVVAERAAEAFMGSRQAVKPSAPTQSPVEKIDDKPADEITPPATKTAADTTPISPTPSTPDADAKKDEDLKSLQFKITQAARRVSSHKLGEDGMRGWIDNIVDGFAYDSVARRIDKGVLLDAMKRQVELLDFSENQQRKSGLDLKVKPEAKSGDWTADVVKDVANVPSNMWEAAKRGGETFIQDMAGVASMFGSKDAAKFAKNLSEYKAAEEEQNPVAGDNLATQALYGMASMAPGMITAIAAGVPTGGLGTAAVFGLQGAGALYNELDGQGVDKSISIPIAIVGGAVNGLLGNMQMAKMIPAAYREEGVGIVRRAVAKAMGENAGKVASFGANIAEQTGLMAGMNVTNILLSDVAKKINDRPLSSI